MKVRSMVGLIPLFACLVLEDDVIQKLPGFRKRLQWFLNNRKDLAKQVIKTFNISKKRLYNIFDRYHIWIHSRRGSSVIC